MGIKKQGSTWILDYRIGGKRRRVSTGTSNKKIAQKMWDDLRLQIHQKKIGITVQPDLLLQDFFDIYISRKHTSSVQADVWNGRKHVLPFFGHRKISSLTAGDIEGFKAHLAKELSAATVNRILALLRHMLNMAVEWEYIQRSPFKTKLLKEHGRERVLSREEEARLLENCKGKLWLFIKIAFATGARAGEIKNLRWGNVFMDGRYFQFVRTKNGKTRTVAMNKEIHSILSFMCPNFHQDRVVGLTTVTKAFRKACQAAGLETEGPDRVTPHTIRHTVATRLSLAGVDLPTIGSILGHSQPSTIFKYAHPGSQTQAVETLCGSSESTHPTFVAE